MIDDMFKLTVDKVFPRKKLNPNIREKTYPINGYNDYENMWEYLCQLSPIKIPNNGQKPFCI